MEDNKLICKLCGYTSSNVTGMCIHLSKIHKYDKQMMKEYYDTYFKKENEGICYFCKQESFFFNISKGYHRICRSDECVSKTRASATPEFWMYKNNISMEEALVIHNERMERMGKTVKKVFDQILETDPDFNKKRSHQNKEFWMNKGLTEKESIDKSYIIMKMIHKKTSIKKKENYDFYKDTYTTNKEYYMKRGFSEEESLQKVKERQSTFSLEKCIDKHGECQGKEIWLDRQYKWHSNYKKSNFSKVSQELFWFVYNELDEDDKKYIKFATLKNGTIDSSGSNNELRLKLDKVILPDFINIKNNKIIEFNGMYYHDMRVDKDIERNEILINNGYIILYIDEMDYYKDKEKVIEQCINFLSE